MATKKKLLQAAAGAGGGEPGLNVEEVFSTYLYEGNGSTQTITNGIDLDGEGGLVWFKSRDFTFDHTLIDTERGTSAYLNSASTNGSNFISGFTSFNSDGFTISTNENKFNYSTSGYNDYVSWTFRKAPKFFDVVTYTGNGVAGRTISHNLGTTVGMIVVKRTDQSGRDWIVYHRGEAGKWGKLNELGAFTTSFAANYFGDNSTVISPTSTEFTVGTAGGPINASGGTYVAYLFAHNDGDGEFGPDGDADIIKCGSFTGNGSSTGPEIDLGFEPQFVIIKRTDDTADWLLWDAMRGAGSNNTVKLQINTSNNEDTLGEPIGFNATGFQPLGADSEINNGSGTYIYIAIRRGPMAVPTDATDVFAVTETSAANNAEITIGFPTDLHIANFTGGDTSNSSVYDRIRGFKTSAVNGTGLITSSTAAENTSYNITYAPNMTGYKQGNWYANSNSVRWDWKRAPNYFDAVAYTGDGVAGRTVSHNLGVAPEMMWVKRRDTTGEWAVYHSGVDASAPEDYYLLLTATNARATSTTVWNDTAPTSDVFSVGTIGWVNASGHDYIAYLFASLDGVSKVGSYTGNDNGSNSQVIDCGFSSGARFVLIKLTSTSGYDWYVFDSERGIVAGDDPRILLNTTGSEATLSDMIDPHSSGFEVRSSTLNVSGATYIFYAIA